MRTVHVKAGKGYEVRIGRGLIGACGEMIREVSSAEKILLVSDDRVFSLYGEKMTGILTDAGFTVSTYTFLHGEESKTLATYGEILETACAEGLSRSDLIVALGGGVVGDMAGFAAATYQRGIGFVQIPTTLLACVDSSVGGKTAIDLKNGKNQAGAFYQPLLVVIDPDVLQTLPEVEYRNGMAEIIKTAVLDGKTFFSRILEKPVKEQYEEIIAYCVDFKRKYVEEDEFDLGLRMKLNLGHTIGHAVEACSDYRIPHGQGVAIGLAAISRAAVRLGNLSEAECAWIIELLHAYGLPTELPYGTEELYRAAGNDKKNTGGSMRIIEPDAIGDCAIQKIPREAFKDWLVAGAGGRNSAGAAESEGV